MKTKQTNPVPADAIGELRSEQLEQISAGLSGIAALIAVCQLKADQANQNAM